MNISSFAESVIITQFQLTYIIKAFDNALIEILIIYNSMIFIFIRRNYPIYKRKLYIIIKFIKKYDYFYKYPYYTSIIYINYKPLTYFLKSDTYKGIYNH